MDEDSSHNSTMTPSSASRSFLVSPMSTMSAAQAALQPDGATIFGNDVDDVDGTTKTAKEEPTRGVQKTLSLRRGAAGYNQLLQSAVMASIETRRAVNEWANMDDGDDDNDADVGKNDTNDTRRMMPLGPAPFPRASLDLSSHEGSKSSSHGGNGDAITAKSAHKPHWSGKLVRKRNRHEEDLRVFHHQHQAPGCRLANDDNATYPPTPSLSRTVSGTGSLRNEQDYGAAEMGSFIDMNADDTDE